MKRRRCEKCDVRRATVWITMPDGRSAGLCEVCAAEHIREHGAEAIAYQESRYQFVRICDCGCGMPTLLAFQSSTRQGWISGQPLPRVRNHHAVRAYEVNAETGCWEWQRFLNREGYGDIHYGGKHTLAHRVEWEKWNGPIPPGLQLDHLCRVRTCINPAHLEIVTPEENQRRGNGWRGRAMRTGKCAQGHEWTPENTLQTPIQRVCRTCKAAIARRNREAAR